MFQIDTPSPNVPMERKSRICIFLPTKCSDGTYSEVQIRSHETYSEVQIRSHRTYSEVQI